MPYLYGSTALKDYCVPFTANTMPLPTPRKLKGNSDSHIMYLNDATSMKNRERLNMEQCPSLSANSTTWSNTDFYTNIVILAICNSNILLPAIRNIYESQQLLSLHSPHFLSCISQQIYMAQAIQHTLHRACTLKNETFRAHKACSKKCGILPFYNPWFNTMQLLVNNVALTTCGTTI
jgi:hypothetical protein